MKNILFFIFIGFVSSFGWAQSSSDLTLLQEGDLIFQKTHSPQSKAIEEATGSDWTHVGLLVKKGSQWYVAEASQTVQVTTLSNFINRGVNKEFQVLRFQPFQESKRKNTLHSVLKKFASLPYDIYFEFSDQRIYCSELTYKVMKQITGQDLGIVNKIKDLKLDGPYVQELIKIRLTDLGKELNLEEPIVTPITQMQDSQLQLVIKSR